MSPAGLRSFFSNGTNARKGVERSLFARFYDLSNVGEASQSITNTLCGGQIMPGNQRTIVYFGYSYFCTLFSMSSYQHGTNLCAHKLFWSQQQ